jgi:TRAP-type C4-dicarboxylate transport system permease small subunit
MRVNKLTCRLQALANAIGGGLFVCLFGVFILQIVARFGFNQPLPWTDELAVVVYVWVIIWSAALVVPEREHVVLDWVWNHASQRMRQAMRIAGNLLMGALALVAIPASWDYIQFMARERTPVLDIPFMLVFLPLLILLVVLVAKSVLAVVATVRGRVGEATP